MKNLILLALLFAPVLLLSQIQATTSDGRKVTLNADGTWKYADTPAPTPAAVSDCKYIKNEVDSFTGDAEKTLKPVEIGKTNTGRKVFASLGKVGETAFVTFKANGIDLGCLSENRSKALLKFQDGKVREFTYRGKTDCGEDVSFLMLLITDELIKGAKEVGPVQAETIGILKANALDQIRLRGTEFYTDIELSEEGKNYFTSYLSCID